MAKRFSQMKAMFEKIFQNFSSFAWIYVKTIKQEQIKVDTKHLPKEKFWFFVSDTFFTFEYEFIFVHTIRIKFLPSLGWCFRRIKQNGLILDDEELKMNL